MVCKYNRKAYYISVNEINGGWIFDYDNPNLRFRIDDIDVANIENGKDEKEQGRRAAMIYNRYLAGYNINFGYYPVPNTYQITGKQPTSDYLSYWHYRTETKSRYSAFDNIQKVIFNPPATIILWKNGSKTVVKCSEKDEFDPEKGFAMCLLKEMFGEKYYKDMQKIIEEKSKFCEQKEETKTESGSNISRTFKEGIDLIQSVFGDSGMK